MSLFDSIFGRSENTVREQPIQKPQNRNSFSDEAIAFGTNMMRNNNDYLTAVYKKISDRVFSDLDKYMRSTPETAAKNEIGIQKYEIVIISNSIYTGVTCQNNYDFREAIHAVTYNECGYNNPDKNEEYKCYGIIYALLEMLCPELRARYDKIRSIDVDLENKSYKYDLRIDASIKLQIDFGTIKKYKDL